MVASQNAPTDEAHEVLTRHDLPAGLLPAQLSACRFDAATGRLEVELPGKACARFDGIPVRYASQVRAVVEPGAIYELEGVEARFALWLKVRAIRREGDSLVFAVGRIGKRLPLSAFR